MVNSKGLRARTRDLFCRPYRKNGPRNATTFLTTYRAGDYVDIKCDSSQQKGMPYKFYHGRTGVVRNVTRRALGVEVTKKVGNRVINKRINVRIEHVQKSKCRDDFLQRTRENDILKGAAAKEGKRISTKRTPILPKPGKAVKAKVAPVTIQPQPYEIIL
eukprot:TRINITY_DN28493_c0_g1_i1.p1 TRINITY_DN28493_c0_g1~~TRINITY_DN28493_c0_g1_i1.p1  ORF type:complete len:160 (-),score=47.77 TRINITY_DN28493_c0_g1_i1:269-748(-)